MKSKHLLLTVLWLFCFSQGFARRTLIVNNNNTRPGEYASIPLAVAAMTVVDDYVLYLKPSPTTYTGLNYIVPGVSPLPSMFYSGKNLLVMGGGWNDLLLGSGNTSKLDRVYFMSSYSVYFAGLDIQSFQPGSRVNLYRCRIGQITNDGFSINMYGCVYTGVINANDDLNLYNNIIHTTQSIPVSFVGFLNDQKIYNNYISNLNPGGNSFEITGVGSGQKLDIKNNIFNIYGQIIDPLTPLSDVNISYNFANTQPGFSTVSSLFSIDNGNNLVGSSPGFTNVPVATTFNNSYDYHLTSSSVCKNNFGSDGTERGIYGGGGGIIPVLNVNVNHWFSMTGELPIPTVTQMTVTPNTVVYGNNTNVNVHVVSKLPH